MKVFRFGVFRHLLALLNDKFLFVMKNFFLQGLAFAVLWSSGAVAVKFGIRSADPLILAAMRFMFTGVLFAPFYMLNPQTRFIPGGTEWKQVLIYGALNTTVTLGAFSVAQKYVSAGISSLFIAVTPLFILFASTLFLGRKMIRTEVGGMLIAFMGIAAASFGSTVQGHIHPLGILLLIIYVLAYTSSAIYFAKIKSTLTTGVFNVWQVFIGGVMLIPVAMLFKQVHVIRVDSWLVGSLLYMAVALSFVANRLWLNMINVDSVKAANWLYLVPVLGYIYGHFLLGEPIGLWGVAGTMLVLAGQLLSRSKSAKIL
ncbi:DMT family transporter [Mucilaginibacter sp. CSA2-8R]|uniref:DMT family transporter n=1 Tax=Mucilaginibacter sp. CSA2-8R TaxID=3141542 RepID=UPI00315D7C9D